MRCRLFKIFCPVLLMALTLSSVARAQVLQAPWVETSQEQIEKIRMTDLRVLVVDAQGKPVPDAVVNIRMIRHAFMWGVKLEPRLAADNLPAGSGGLRVWRAFSALSLARASQWSSTQPRPESTAFTDAQKLLNWGRSEGLSTRWGTMLWTDRGRWPNWAAKLEGAALQAALENYQKLVLSEFGRSVDHFDVVNYSSSRQGGTDRIDLPMVRRLFEHGKALAPRAMMCVRFEDGLRDDRVLEVIRVVAAMQQGQVPIDVLGVEWRSSGSLQETSLRRNLDKLADLGLPIYISDVEIGGPSGAAAAINLETFLRVAFSHPSVIGISIAGVTPESLSDPTAALLDTLGQPTQAGLVLDNLVRTTWWTQKTQNTDELGNVRTRVFAGQYVIEAKLPDGNSAKLPLVYVPRNAARERLVMLAPITGSGGGGAPATNRAE